MTTTPTAAPATRRRWTNEAIRKATRFPKPQGAIDKVPELHPEPTAVDFVRRILADADLLDVESVNGLGYQTRWLLVPVGYAELEWLGAFDASEDLEGDDREPDADDGEADLAAGNDIDQRKAWSAESASAPEGDESDDEPNEADGPSMDVWVPDWAPWAFPTV